MSRPPPRPIKRLLVANRGEIATRIISSAHELDIETYAIYAPGDVSHAVSASNTIALSSAVDFMSIDVLVGIVKKYGIDAVHPGYGFLSESDEFSERMWRDGGAVVVGPGWSILSRTGDKIKARQLAEKCKVPTAPALQTPTNDVDQVRQFASKIGYPIIVKAVDGGGGRGIRLIRNEGQLASSVKRAVEEGLSKQLFAEKAAVDGFRHIEVQIIGDGTGNVTHLWERECSIQRRYQKVVEIAPSVVDNRNLVAKVIEAAMVMARAVQYFSLGTFEFLVNPSTEEFYFLEVNPRLQVEHTITESISLTDIVKVQLLLSQGADLQSCGLPVADRNPRVPSPAYSIQLRITAENVQSNWSLSIGKITGFQFPTGNGVRVDTHLISGRPAIVSADFDSLIAKVIVTASGWEDTVQKAQRALKDTHVAGVKTNVDVLRAIVAHPDFLHGKCDTQWLEANQYELLELSQKISTSKNNPISHLLETSSSGPAMSASNTLFRKGDAWSITLSTPGDENVEANSSTRHLELTRILRNEFPTSMSAEVLFTTPSASSSSQPQSTPYTVTLTSTSSSASAATSHHRRGNPFDPSHINIPFPGKLVEVLIDEGDVVKEGDVICVVQQMKMELEVRTPRSGKISWVTEAEDDDEVSEGMLAAIVEIERDARL